MPTLFNVPFVAIAAAVALAAYTPLWRGLRLIVTFLHELGHAVTAGAVGGGVRRVVVRLDTSGHTEYMAPRGRMRAILVSGAGYVSPAVAAVVCAVSVQPARAEVFTFVSAGITVLVVVGWVRHLFTLMLATAAAGLLVLAGYYGVAEPTQCALAGLFAAGAVRASYEQHRVRDRPASDAGQLRAATGLPAWVFSWLFIAIGAASAAAVTVVLSIPQVAV